MARTRDWRAAELKALDREPLRHLFRQLGAPRASEMRGEFDSTLPDYSEPEWRAAMQRVGKDYWLGKAYVPEGFEGSRGHGYNRYRRADGTIARNSRFAWDIAPSSIDGRDSLVMRYGPFKNWGGSNDLIDEIRMAGPDVYLGLYHTATPLPGFTPRAGGPDGRSDIEFFILMGPVLPFTGADAPEL